MNRWDVVEEEGLEDALTVHQAMVKPGAEPFPLVSNAVTGSMAALKKHQALPVMIRRGS